MNLFTTQNVFFFPEGFKLGFEAKLTMRHTLHALGAVNQSLTVLRDLLADGEIGSDAERPRLSVAMLCC